MFEVDSIIFSVQNNAQGVASRQTGDSELHAQRSTPTVTDESSPRLKVRGAQSFASQNHLVGELHHEEKGENHVAQINVARKRKGWFFARLAALFGTSGFVSKPDIQ